MKLPAAALLLAAALSAAVAPAQDAPDQPAPDQPAPDQTATNQPATDQPATNHFELGTEALRQGRYQDAIDRLEAYADRAPSHPDASFNRGLAYVMRVRNGDEQPGDLGRAAAAFEETLAMRSGDADARQALAMVQGEVAKRRARRGQDSLLAKGTLDRVVIQLASERTWGIAAIVSSFLLALGIILWRRPGTHHLAGIVIAPASAIALAALVPLYLGARDLRLHTRTGVVVVPEAQITDEEGKPAGGDPIPETARLELGESRGRYIHIRYGAREGWLPISAIRTLRTR